MDIHCLKSIGEGERDGDGDMQRDAVRELLMSMWKVIEAHARES
jgi:hypothetical protein